MRLLRNRLVGLREQILARDTSVPRVIAVFDDGGPPGLRPVGPPGSAAAVYVPGRGDTDPVASARHLAPDAAIVVGVDPHVI